MRILVLVSAFLFSSCYTATPLPPDTPPEFPPQNTPISGQQCGGMMGQTCPAHTFCNYPMEAQCGAADATGTCQPIPELCPMNYAPICGCNDQTYPNACAANAVGVSVAAEGPCP